MLKWTRTPEGDYEAGSYRLERPTGASATGGGWDLYDAKGFVDHYPTLTEGKNAAEAGRVSGRAEVGVTTKPIDKIRSKYR